MSLVFNSFENFLNSLLTSRARNTHCCILMPILVSRLSSKLCPCVSVNCAPFIQMISHLKPLQSEQRRHSWHSECVSWCSSFLRGLFILRGALFCVFRQHGSLLVRSLQSDVNVLNTRCSLSSRFSFLLFPDRT